MTDVPCALGLARKPAGFRQQPEDFIVTEMLGFELTGDGEHLWLEVEKTGLNTVDVARQLASLAGVKERDVAYAGLKDRHAVATQWFSLPGKSVAQLPETEQSGWRILRQVRNSRKLGRGSHRGNRFVITLRDVMIAPDELGHWQRELTTTGCPNYFGPQRFGHDGGNLDKAKALFAGTLKAGRHQRGLYCQRLGRGFSTRCWRNVSATVPGTGRSPVMSWPCPAAPVCFGRKLTMPP